MRFVSVVLIVAMLACSSSQSNMREDEYIREFLTAWLVNDDLQQAREYLSPQFQSPASQSADEAFPESIREMPDPDRSLAYATRCTEVRLRCPDLGSCVAAPAVANALYERQVLLVTDDLIIEFPSLSDLRGQQVTSIVTKLRSCNVGVGVLIDHSPTKQRIRSILYIAP
jgi:hypothetical protein